MTYPYIFLPPIVESFVISCSYFNVLSSRKKINVRKRNEIPREKKINNKENFISSNFLNSYENSRDILNSFNQHKINPKNLSTY